MLTDPLHLTPQDYKMIRRHAVKFCYQQEINQEHAYTDELLVRFIEYFEIEKEQQDFFKKLIAKIFELMPKCDEFIEKHSKNWKIFRIAKVDLSILRVAITEIMVREKTDPAIMISDALAIAEDFSSKDSARFINGILDSIVRTMREESRCEH